MMKRGVRTPSGRGRWHATTVRRALALTASGATGCAANPDGSRDVEEEDAAKAE